MVLVAMPAGADDGPVRLLVTYDAEVDARTVDRDLGRFSSASVVDDAVDLAPSPVQVVEVADGASAAGIARRLEQHDHVVAVEPDVRLYIDRSAVGAAGTTVTTALSPPPAWGLDNTGQLVAGEPGRRGIDIGARQAWPTATGHGVVVAVIDTPLDIDHPLLRDRIWRNPFERRDGTDRDGNGYVDDVHGWNFVDDSPQVSVSPQRDYHATHVAGIIVGQRHDDTGFSGVAPDARVMPLPFIDATGAGWASDAVRAIRYAVDNGADVINTSWAGPQNSWALRTAIASVGVPVVTSAGNTGRSHEREPVFPAAYGLDNQLSVAAVDHTGDLAAYSATSRDTVDLAAPGTAILSTVPDRRLAVESGTSMSAPFVAGAVALTLESAPDATAVEVVEAVRAGVRPLAGAVQTATGGIARAGGAIAAAGEPVPVCRDRLHSQFDDVPAGHTHHRGVACLSALEITRGVTADLYGAAEQLRREQVASLVARTLERAELLPDAPAEPQFDDLDGSVHRDAVERLAAIGVVEAGDDADTDADAAERRFDPGAVVSRGEFAGLVARAAEHAAGAPSRTPAPHFDDIAGSPHRQGIVTAAQMSLVLGHGDGSFGPDADVRRDQAATMLVRLLDRLHQQGLLDPA